MAEAIINTPMRSLRNLPGMRHLAILIGLAAAVAVGVMTWSYTQKPGLAPLVSGLEPKDAAAIADALRSANIEYQADATTGAILVPGDKLLDARMKLAAAGLPKSSSMGFEMIQQEQGFGTSQFIENARYQHALETELARTVSSLQSVQNARVHLALPKQSVFAGAGTAASASVLLDLAAGRSLDSTQVDSIVHLVASSVPNLAANNVTVIDQYGHLLNSSGDADDPARRASKEFEQKRRIETDLVRRVEQLLMPLAGSGRVSAQVVADMDFAEVEEASETYKPDSAVVRSEQTSEDVSRSPGVGGNAQGVPGATSNQPPNAAQAQPLNPPGAIAAAKQGSATSAAVATAPGALPLTENRNSTRNYELDRTISHVKRPGGSIKRLSVAVLVDNLPKKDDKGATTYVPLTTEQMAKVQDLVKQAVGFDEKRGDTLSVQNAAFADEPVAPVEAEPIWQNPMVRDIARRVIGAAVLIALIVMVLKPAFKFLTDSPLTERLSATVVGERVAAAAGAAHAALAATESMEQLPKAMPAYEQKLNQARGAVSQDPKRVAQIVKTWVNPDG